MSMSMSHLSMMEARLPPGFRFHPRDDELICDYLAKKVKREPGNGSGHGWSMIVDVDLNKCEPWDLPEMACVGGKEWYFFSLRDRKYATGYRTNRATESGYWKATGKDRMVSRKGVLVGMRKTLVFYQGRAPKGTKTDWVMHEFHTQDSVNSSQFSFKDWVLCKVSFKSRSKIAKINIDNRQDKTSSSAFLPLKNTYITFNQVPHGLNGYEQGPCFSNLSNGLATPLMAPIDLGRFDKKLIESTSSRLTTLDGYFKKGYPLDSIGGNFENYLRDKSPSYLWGSLK